MKETKKRRDAIDDWYVSALLKQARVAWRLAEEKAEIEKKRFGKFNSLEEKFREAGIAPEDFGD